MPPSENYLSLEPLLSGCGEVVSPLFHCKETTMLPHRRMQGNIKIPCSANKGLIFSKPKESISTSLLRGYSG
jgi:hypothetical protein